MNTHPFLEYIRVRVRVRVRVSLDGIPLTLTLLENELPLHVLSKNLV